VCIGSARLSCEIKRCAAPFLWSHISVALLQIRWIASTLESPRRRPWPRHDRRLCHFMRILPLAEGSVGFRWVRSRACRGFLRHNSQLLAISATIGRRTASESFPFIGRCAQFFVHLPRQSEVGSYLCGAIRPVNSGEYLPSECKRKSYEIHL
jgi:hypothetical protein